MSKETIFVELVGLDEVFDVAYLTSIKRIILGHASNFYHFAIWDPLDAVQPSAPDISLVAVGDSKDWTLVRPLINRCNCLNIGLLGAENPMLGFPAVSKQCDLSSLVLLRQGSAANSAPFWDAQNHVKPGGALTIPATLNNY